MAAKETPPASRREWCLVAAIALASLAVRLPVAIHCDIFQDEGLYWWEANEPGVNFCPQPPATSLLVHAGQALLGEGSVLGLRLGSLLWGTASIVLVFLLGRDPYGPATGLWAAALFAVTPLFLGIGSFITPDALLVFLWLLFVWATWRAAAGASGWWWAAAGLVLAAGFYSKYTMALALPCALLALCAAPRGRALLRGPKPWLALALAAAAFAPVFLAWNAANGWASFRYHLSTRHVWTLSPANIAPYLATHAGAISPLIWAGVLAAFVAAWRSWRRGDWGSAWVLSFGLVPIAFFFVPSVFTKKALLRVHWDEMGYAIGLIGLAAAIARLSQPGRPRGRWRRLGVAGIAAAALISGAAFVGSLRPGLAVALRLRPPTRQMLGWRDLARRVRSVRSGWRGAEPVIITDSASTHFCLAFHLRQRQNIYTLDSLVNRRYGLVEPLGVWGIDQPHLVADMESGRLAPEAIFIDQPHHTTRSTFPPPEQLTRLFASVELLEPLLVTRGGRVVVIFTLYACRQWRASSPDRGARSRRSDVAQPTTGDAQ